MFRSLGQVIANIYVILLAHPHSWIALWVAMETMHFHKAQTGSFLELYFAFGGVVMNNLALNKKCPGVQGKHNWPQTIFFFNLYWAGMFIIINTVFFANVNLAAVANLCAILFSRTCVFVNIGSILWWKKVFTIFKCHFFWIIALTWPLT